MNYFLGIDVGTGSVRVGLFTGKGKLIAHKAQAIKVWKPEADYVEQSSEDIWQSLCTACRDLLADSKIKPELIKGIGFDATCSLVLVDSQGDGVSVSPSGSDDQNIIVWMDHRAIDEAEFINQFKSDFPAFKFVGGKISPEMQLPKLLWLKKHLPESWERATDFFDLPDYLTYRATGNKTRSLCSLTCKWSYNKNSKADQGWDRQFFEAIGLSEFPEANYVPIGSLVAPMGQSLGGGLSIQSAQEMGLIAGTPVGVSIIDAHAGGLGMIGLEEPGQSVDFNHRLALIGGTSSCHMALSEKLRFIPGLWGPYDSAMVPDFWLNEGGQSATGSLIDHVILSHSAYFEAKSEADRCKQSIYDFLNEYLHDLVEKSQCSLDELSRDFHVCPYFHGNRSPRANPDLKGMLSGLKLSATIEDLAVLYLATIQAIAYGTRHIIETMNQSGYAIDTLICCGGGTKNELFLQQHATITGCQLILPEEMESVLLGSAMLGAVASGEYRHIGEAMRNMSHFGKLIRPNRKHRAFHEKKYQVFHKLYTDQMHYKEIME